MIAENAWVPLAEVARPHGVAGELRLRLFNRDSDILLELGEVLVRLPGGEEHEVSVDSARRADQAILMKLYSVDDRDRAEELRGALICGKRGDFSPLGEGEFYTCDALGAPVVFLDPAGASIELGHVRDLLSYPSVDTLIVRAADGGSDWEIPLVAAFISEADVGAPGKEGRFVVSSMEGLERPVPGKKKSAVKPPRKRHPRKAKGTDPIRGVDMDREQSGDEKTDEGTG